MRKVIWSSNCPAISLNGIRRSPHVAVLLNVVPEHLDLHGGFDNYVRAKRNITRFQTADDILVYNATYPIPRAVASATKARRLAFSLETMASPGSYLDSGQLIYCAASGIREPIMPVSDVTLPGRFNLQNVLAAITVGAAMGVGRGAIAKAVRDFAGPWRTGWSESEPGAA